jgi:hypothetical protein
VSTDNLGNLTADQTAIDDARIFVINLDNIGGGLYNAGFVYRQRADLEAAPYFLLYALHFTFTNGLTMYGNDGNMNQLSSSSAFQAFFVQ